MAIAVPDFATFRRTFSQLAEDSGLYAFFLYSNAGHHAAAAEFVAARKYYFNDLAVNAGTFLFFFDEEIASSPVANPSAAVAGLFGISMSDLPGLLVFSKIDEDRINEGVFFRLSGDAMASNPQSIEQRLGGIFATLRKAQDPAVGVAAQLDQLRGEDRRQAAEQRWRDIRSTLGIAFSGMRNLPTVFVETVAKTLVQQAVR